ncbi:DUF1987 domain-containing protein [Azospira inquinata]|uniref:DUF1987 domain-containing protein n=1 Tax=Azospira inquinata TaxID=2785627 RepID=A0A975SLA6_9RHOO|nr:DUF1987 domain-containing protein [Azospira inquinata]QWT46305.1 DUF1987 domain-containing protein [Azospira inquinata]QWT48368.1 DUF1987 domain-containing protein [Azospira inquinata]
MDNLYIPAGRDTPEVDFRFDAHRLSLAGEAYPENAAAFFGPLLAATRRYLQQRDGRPLEVHIDLAYFNSSSTKVLFDLFSLLDQAAARENGVQVVWHYDPEDEMSLEFEQDLAAEFRHLDCQARSKP